MEDNSILNNIRSLLVGDEDDTSFDLDLVFTINTALNNLTDVGVGPAEGFQITGTNETWEDFIGKDKVILNRVKTYVELETRLIFDTPTNSNVLEMLKEKANEALVRANWAVDDQSGKKREVEKDE
jgi:hypothetical protein